MVYLYLFNELQFICDNITTLGLQTAFLDLDVTLARGLNYYTGAIFEVAADLWMVNHFEQLLPRNFRKSLYIF